VFNFDEPCFKKVVQDAIALRPQIETIADAISKDGFSNIFFIGCGGTYAHSLPMKYWLDSESSLETHTVIAAEFMLMGHKKFSKDSICLFSTRSGNTKEIVEAAKFCRNAGARTVVYVCNPDTPIYAHANYLVQSYAEDDHLCEAIYTFMITFLSRLLKNAGQFADYDSFMDQYSKIADYLLKGKELYESRCAAFAAEHKDTGYYMVAGAGMLWGEAYDYAMCILEEMQWLKTKSIHGAEFFHGTLELMEPDTTLLAFLGEDETAPLMDRLLKFSQTITKDIFKFDTKEVKLPVDAKRRKILSPMVMCTITERLSCHLEKVRNHKLTTRRYYRQMDY
jgi:fructoselysine-6-phosphate deglycase